MLIDDYLDYQIQYQKKYGDKTIILMQVGSFFEAYAIDGIHEKINVENLYYICDLMNIQISRKNKNIVKSSRSNPLMAGFPLPAIDKFIQILMNNHFTVVLVEQVTEPPEPERKITNIFSPGTQINYCPSEETSNLVSIYIETIKDLKDSDDPIQLIIDRVKEAFSGFGESLITETKAFVKTYIDDEVVNKRKQLNLKNASEYFVKYYVIHERLRNDTTLFHKLSLFCRGRVEDSMRQVPLNAARYIVETKCI